jgi:hypothetical protein
MQTALLSDQAYPQIMTEIRFVACLPKDTFGETLETREGCTGKSGFVPLLQSAVLLPDRLYLASSTLTQVLLTPL